MLFFPFFIAQKYRIFCAALLGLLGVGFGGWVWGGVGEILGGGPGGWLGGGGGIITFVCVCVLSFRAFSVVFYNGGKHLLFSCISYIFICYIYI